MLKLPGHGRYDYSPIEQRQNFNWPNGKRVPGEFANPRINGSA
jgi:hypothetical protein